MKPPLTSRTLPGGAATCSTSVSGSSVDPNAKNPAASPPVPEPSVPAGASCDGGDSRARCESRTRGASVFGNGAGSGERWAIRS